MKKMLIIRQSDNRSVGLLINQIDIGEECCSIRFNSVSTKISNKQKMKYLWKKQKQKQKQKQEQKQ